MKKTKKALVMSALSLLACVSMLIGSTFAWFTDSVTSANNIIKSGNLDIELYYQVEGQTDWAKVDANTNIFMKEALWEPGHTEVVKLKVVNEGTLALKYQLGVNIASEVGSVNVDGKEFLLSDHIKYGIVDGDQTYTRDAAVAAVDATAPALKTPYNKTSTLQAGKEAIVTMVVYMPTTVGNEANHAKGATVPTINLGINLFATQYTSESDSFGSDYDKASPWASYVDTAWYNDTATEFVIGSAEELAGLAQLVNTGVDFFEDKTIELSANIDLRNLPWTPIGAVTFDRANSGSYVVKSAFKGTFDGQGHTISNLKVYAPETNGVALFGAVDAAVIKNINIKNVDIVADGTAASLVAYAINYGANKATTIANCNVSGDISIVADWAYVGGIAAYGHINVDKCSVIGNDDSALVSENRNAVGGIVGWNYGVSVTGCKVENLSLTGWANIGGIEGYIGAGHTVSNNSVKNVEMTKTRADGHPTIGLISGGWSYNASQAITIDGNTINGVILNGNYVAKASADILYGAEYAGSDISNFVLDNNTTVNVTNNLIEVTKITDGIVEATDGTKMIYNANGLKSLSGQKISGKYELMADIDLGGAEFKAMSAFYASATFDGNGHTISNAKVVSGDNDNGTEQASMFFVSTNGALTVSDLTLKDIVVATKNIDNGYAAAVVGYCEGALVLDNVDVVNADVTGSKSSGMLVGHLTPSGSLTATDCDVAGSIIISSFEASGHYAGQYVGTIAGNTALNNCTANVTLGGNLKSTNDGTIYGRKVSGDLTVDGAVPATTTAALIDAIKNAPVGETTTIALTNDVYAGDIEITLAALGKQGGDVVIKAAKGAKPVMTGMITLGYRKQGTGAAMYNANVTFDGITFKQAVADTHSINVQDVKSLTLVNCSIINNGEYGIASASGNATGASKIEACTFENAGMQLLGNYATGLVIDGCTFNDSRINVQAGNGVTIQNCKFNGTLTDAHVGDSFYMIRSNSTPITVKNCEINVDSTVTGVVTGQAKWYLLANRGTTNWTVEKVAVTMTDAALAQTSLVVTACTSTGAINATNLTVNGVAQ